MMKKRENYLINIFGDIKWIVSNTFLFNLFKSSKEELEKNLDLSVLNKSIQLYVAKNNLIAINKEDFKKN